MPRILFTVVLAALPLWGGAEPAQGVVQPAVRDAAASPALPQAEQSKDQRRAALRQVLVHRQDAGADLPEGQTARQLSPAERAELRRQLRDQSSR